MARSRHALVALVSVALLAGGCATARLYDGPARPPSEIALLTLETDRASLKLIEFDRVEVLARSAEMLPGEHRMRVMMKYMQRFNSGYVTTSFKVQIRCRARFEAEAGHRYVMRPVAEQVAEGSLQESVAFSIVVEDEAAPGVSIGDTRCYY